LKIAPDGAQKDYLRYALTLKEGAGLKASRREFRVPGTRGFCGLGFQTPGARSFCVLGAERALPGG